MITKNDFFILLYIADNLFQPLRKLNYQELPSNPYKRHLYLRYQKLITSSISAHACEWKFFELAASSEGSATKISKSGEALNLRSIPQKFDYPPRTLIVGGPGMGKSSIVTELCKRWYNKHLLQEYEYVILLDGHSPQINNAKDLDDLVLNPEWMIPIRKADGKNSLFIIDGYEDLSEKCRQQNSFIDRFISGRILHEASCIVTTRPWCAKAISKYFSNETTVVLGFTQQGRKEFIEYNLKGDADEFNHLQKQVEGCSTIPFCLATLIEIYHEKRKLNPQASKVSLTFPKTLFMVYGELIRTLVLQFVRKNQEYLKFMPDSIEIPPGEFIKFPGPIYRSFLELCAFSYTSMMQPSEHNVSPGIETFDLFKQHATENTSGNKTYYTCLHSSIQEYLAAYCISRMNEVDRKSCIDSLTQSNHRYHLMLEFLVDFKCFIPSISRKCFSNVHDFYIFRQLCEVNSDKLIQDAFSNHVNPCTIKRTWPLPSPADFWCLGKVLALSNRHWRLVFTLRCLQNSHLQMLCEGINSVDLPSGQIEKFALALNKIDENGIRYLFQINEKCLSEIREINLHANQLNSNVIPILCDSLPLKATHLKKLTFHHNEIQPGDHKPLIMDGLARCNYLEHVSLSNLKPDECHLLLTNMNSLRIVELWQISPQSCKVVFDTLPQTSIQQLEIHESELNNDCFKDLHITLPQSQVTTLKLINCGIDSVMVEVIVRAAAEKLSSIDLSDNVICDNGGESLLRLHKRFGVDLLETEKCNNFSDHMLRAFLYLT